MAASAGTNILHMTDSGRATGRVGVRASALVQRIACKSGIGLPLSLPRRPSLVRSLLLIAVAIAIAMVDREDGKDSKDSEGYSTCHRRATLLSKCPSPKLSRATAHFPFGAVGNWTCCKLAGAPC